ncbi:DUF4230 domain-containing protein [Clostridium neuense]|uniref:DUF4230 domain-containing protein n=1 Tax=Clostridium neuense TaxID=1728934 RepID=A0ABW8TLU8_9CLOT
MRFNIRKRTILLALLFTILLCFFSYKLSGFFKGNSKPWIVADANDASKKFITKDTVIKKIHQKQKLITTEVEISEKTTIDNSWGNLDIFKKMQNISFTGKGVYVVDLSLLKSSNIYIDSNNNILAIKIPKPKVELVTIDESKTVYETPEKGLLRFGDIKLTAQEHEVMVENVKKAMLEKMNETEYSNKAIINSRKSMETIIKSILNSNSKYTIKIEFL